MEQRLRQQSVALEAREGASVLKPSTVTSMDDHQDLNHYSCAEGGESATTVATLADESAPSDSRVGHLRGPSTDTAVQRQERPTAIPLSIRRSSDDDSAFDGYNTDNASIDVTHLEESLMQVLIDFFYQSIYPIFPIITQRRFRQQYNLWSVQEGGKTFTAANDFPILLYAILAVAASVIPKDHEVFAEAGFEVYKWIDLAELLYRHAISLSTGKSYQPSPSAAINTIAAQGLLSLYLIERGKVNDAWVTAGHAIRLYQGFDLKDSVNLAGEANELRLAHTNLWWCLYILDRSLSTALLKPLAIDDAESEIDSCDGENYSASSAAQNANPWFSVIADFHITMGRIYRSVRLIRKPESSQNIKLKDTLRSYVKRHDAELEKYYTKQVLPKLETPNSEVGRLALQAIAVSSYHIGLVLLYRTFIERFNIAEPEAFLRCAEAASNCIKASPQVIAHVPASHFVIQQSRAIFASAKVLLHCMRLARNPSFTRKAWMDVESGLNMLREVKIQWPEIKKYQLLTEEDMRLTQNELSKHDLFYQTFGNFGQRACTRDNEESDTPGANRTHSIHFPEGSLDFQGLDYSPWELSNDSIINILDTDCSQGATSFKHSRLDDPSQQHSKRRKLSPLPSRRLSSSNDLPTLEMLPILRDSSDCPIMDHMITTGGLFLPDVSPRQIASEEVSTSFFGDAMLTDSIDQFFSQPDG
ncbi:hypothetical protein PENSUB_488 [Penicillium subrubescens]|uniref:Xylanolytic transcriptional activator regulatory domain-containing protein n=2 Tax=Penicillium subrubescens TaxID=1316194 RepID=A0A1Q5UN78_9EURO|nr:hypothetical protein PENSUB_488 [Penicillium subrubescens]